MAISYTQGEARQIVVDPSGDYKVKKPAKARLPSGKIAYEKGRPGSNVWRYYSRHANRWMYYKGGKQEIIEETVYDIPVRSEDLPVVKVSDIAIKKMGEKEIARRVERGTIEPERAKTELERRQVIAKKEADRIAAEKAAAMEAERQRALKESKKFVGITPIKKGKPAETTQVYGETKEGKPVLVGEAKTEEFQARARAEAEARKPKPPKPKPPKPKPMKPKPTDFKTEAEKMPMTTQRTVTQEELLERKPTKKAITQTTPTTAKPISKDVIVKPKEDGYKKFAEKVWEEATPLEKAGLATHTLLSPKGFEFIGSFIGGEKRPKQVVKERIAELREKEIWKKPVEQQVLHHAESAIVNPVVVVEASYLAGAAVSAAGATAIGTKVLAAPPVKAGMVALGAGGLIGSGYDIKKTWERGEKSLALGKGITLGAGFIAGGLGAKHQAEYMWRTEEPKTFFAEEVTKPTGKIKESEGMARTKFLGKEYPSSYKTRYKTEPTDIEGLSETKSLSGVVTKIDKGKTAKTVAGTKGLVREFQIGDKKAQAGIGLSKTVTQVGKYDPSKLVVGEQAGKSISVEIEPDLWVTMGETLTREGQRGAIGGLTKIPSDLPEESFFTFTPGKKLTFGQRVDVSKIIGQTVKTATKPGIKTGITGALIGIKPPTPTTKKIKSKTPKRVEIIPGFQLVERPRPRIVPQERVDIKPVAIEAPIYPGEDLTFPESTGFPILEGESSPFSPPKKRKAKEEEQYIIQPPGSPVPIAPVPKPAPDKIIGLPPDADFSKIGSRTPKEELEKKVISLPGIDITPVVTLTPESTIEKKVVSRKPAVTPVIETIQKQETQLDEALGIKTKTGQKQIQKEKIAIDIKPLIVSPKLQLDLGTRIVTDQSVRLGQRLKVDQKIDQLLDPGTITGQPPLPMPPKVPPFDFDLPGLKGKDRPRGRGYDVYLKRFGEPVKISDIPMVKGQALALGKARAQKTLGATFWLKPTEQRAVRLPGVPRITEQQIGKKFRQYRKKKGARLPLEPLKFIQRAPFRLEAPEELLEIQEARKRAAKPRKRENQFRMPDLFNLGKRRKKK